MAVAVNVINTYFGRCRCCLSYGYLKNMWEEHYRDGGKEIYVEMLVDCFALDWEQSEGASKHDQICETCIIRLRDANSFKKTILESQMKLLNQTEEPEMPIKIGQIMECKEDSEIEDAEDSLQNTVDDNQDSGDPDCHDDACYLDADKQDEMNYEDVEYLEDEHLKINDMRQPKIPIKEGQIMECKEDLEIEDAEDSLQNTVDDNQDSGDPDYHDDACYLDADEQDEMNYEDVEYLEDEHIKINEMPHREKQIIRNTKMPNLISITKWPKKLPNSEQYKTFKRYAEEDLEICMKAVKDENLTPREASQKFNIPRSTIRAKLKSDAEEHSKEKRHFKKMNREKRIEFIKEIKTILSYTNATPFKCLAKTYLCAYCAHEGPTFENPNDLRNHTQTHHTKERTQKIECVMRPFWMNEIIRLDIHDLECVVCSISYPEWNDMLEHLKTKHLVDLNQAYTKAIPYDLTDELKCTLCKQDFTYYNILDAHMNSHYNNYVCFDCGDTCLTEARFKRHVKIHDIGKHACSVCHKVFAILKDKAKHEEIVHNLQPKFKCQYCDERFCGEYLRHIHLLDKHNEKVNVMTCEFCGKTFTWRPYYCKHMRKHDDNTKKFECVICQKRFSLETELKNHMLKHIAEKNLTCYICNKIYTSLASLRRHLNRHKKLSV